MSFVDDLYKVVKVFPAEIFTWKENNPNYIPRRVFKAMEPEVKDEILKKYWIPKEENMPLIKNGISPYIETSEEKTIHWSLPYKLKCAFHGVKMYTTADAKIFYCPLCDKFYSIDEKCVSS